VITKPPLKAIKPCQTADLCPPAHAYASERS
jgi:hypothetical protein